MAELIVWEPDGTVRRRDIGDDGLSLGRSRIAKGSGGVYTIEDPSRRTRVNGRPVVDVVAIRSGDVIVHDSVTAQLVIEEGMMSLDVTLDEGLDEDAGEQTKITTWTPNDQIRTSYDMVAERYASELADEMLARPIERGMYLAFAELALTLGNGPVGDIGCGPGHIAQHLTGLGLDMVGIDLSPTMIAIAHQRFPSGQFWIGSMQQLPFPTGAWTSAISIWATLHSDADARMQTFRELARCVRRGGYLLHSFFVEAPDQPPGSVYLMEKWFDYSVSLPTYFLDVNVAASEVKRAGFAVLATLIREPLISTELPARRCYLLAQRK